MGLFYAGILVAVICLFDWAVRTRRINPFNRVARFSAECRSSHAAGGTRDFAAGSAGFAPWWALVAFAVFGIALITVLEFLGDIFYQVAVVSGQPSQAPMLLLSWAFALLKVALMVRVLSSWFPISPHSKWIRWSYLLTDWLIKPLRRVIPLLGMIDITPIVAWFLIGLIQKFLGIP